MQSSQSLAFRSNEQATLGVELELMLVNPESWDLATSAVAVARETHERGLDAHVKLEITQSMIEINSSVHEDCASLDAELRTLCCELSAAAQSHATRICGGGTHPFHRWQERRISPSGRFHEVAHRYGYLAKQFTVFGQHIHVGCTDGDDAIRVVRVLGRYVPHFVALAAASPFHRGVDTGFDSCRLNIVAAFPLSGRMPPLESWAEFERFYERLRRIGVVGSLKDFYWDVRPKPEFGTIELRVPDTPLEVELASDLAAYAQALVVASRAMAIPEWLDDFVYRHNRFQAARFGLDGQIIVGAEGERVAIHEDVRATIDRLQRVNPACAAALERLRARAAASENGAAWLRRTYAEHDDLRQVVARACDRWRQGCATEAPSSPVTS
jgi:carboxylate-amine ligase